MGFRTLFYSTMGIVFIAHWFLYYSSVRLFSITRRRSRILLGVSLAVLSTLFITGRYTAHYWDSAAARSVYVFGGIWLGTSLYTLAAFAASWAVVISGRLAGLKVRRAAVTGFMLALAALYSCYGVYNAYHPRIKDVRVAIANLPAGWEGRTIVQLSDIHLGFVYRAGFLAGVVRQVNEVSPDMVVITGDLFDGSDGDLAELAAPLRKLHAPRGVYFVTGNHENHLGAEGVMNLLRGTGITVLDNELTDIDGLQVAGISYPKRGTREGYIPARILLSLPGYDRAKPTLLLYHSPSWILEAADAGVSLQLSGHTHNGQMFPFNYITDSIYFGYDYGLYRKKGGYTLYVTNGVGTWGPPMRTGNTPEIVRIKLSKS